MKHEVAKGRGATLQIEGRFESVARERFDDGWGTADDPLPPFKTTVTVEQAKSVIQRHDSPDLPFDYSLNAYRGCERLGLNLEEMWLDVSRFRPPGRGGQMGVF